MLTTEIMLLREIEYQIRVQQHIWAGSEDAEPPKRIHLDGVPDDENPDELTIGAEDPVDIEEMDALLGW